MADRFEDNPKVIFGRKTERLVSAWARFQGCTYADMTASITPGAPMLRRWTASIISPDGLMVRTAPILVEIKGKTHENRSTSGGSPGGNWMAAGTRFHGIPRRSHLAYREGAKQLKMPLVVLLVSLAEGVLLGATLEELGEPFPSLLPEVHDMVNFPCKRFTLLWEFDIKRLRQFYDQDLDRLTEHRMKLFIPWLSKRDQQRSFDFMQFMPFDIAERRWTRTAGA